MSFRNLLSHLNSPALVSAAGASVLASLPYVTKALLENGGAYSMGLLQLINIAAFATNVISVSVPGRIDGQEDAKMRRDSGLLAGTQDGPSSHEYTTLYSPERGRTLVAPSGWAFAIWGPIYLGEVLFCLGGQFMMNDQTALAAIAAPFAAANIMQSLWCASFRPSYYAAAGEWPKFVSVAMLGGTACTLSLVSKVAFTNPDIAWYYLLPMTIHFGWTTAATLVNLNGSIAAIEHVSDRTVIATGHSSALIAAGLGCYVTLAQTAPAYGLTVAWALAACSTGMRKKKTQEGTGIAHSDMMKRAMSVQERLCQLGSVLCILSSAYIIFS